MVKRKKELEGSRRVKDNSVAKVLENQYLEKKEEQEREERMKEGYFHKYLLQ